MYLGYNTNGLAFHRWPDSLDLLIEEGYRSVAITLDHHCLNPYQGESDLETEIEIVRKRLGEGRLDSMVETGARFLLDPRQKHEPTLISRDPDGRAYRIDFLKRSVDIAERLESQAVSFWAGVPRTSDVDEAQRWEWLVAGCKEVAAYAGQKSVRIAFEPEPGMLVESFEQFRRLQQEVDSPLFGLTVDIGHVICVEDSPIPEYIREWGPCIYNVHIEDMCRGVHEHLRFGEGEIDFPSVLKSLDEVGYQGGLNVELSRHSHMAPDVVRESARFLRQAAECAGVLLQ
ncbi:MAG: isomerase [Planctomyces sp.]|nr:isomerase [Planctomyces sp.]